MLIKMIESEGELKMVIRFYGLDDEEVCVYYV